MERDSINSPWLPLEGFDGLNEFVQHFEPRNSAMTCKPRMQDKGEIILLKIAELELTMQVYG
jgi:hypothetical protein